MSTLDLLQDDRKRMTPLSISRSVESVYSSTSSRNSGSMFRRKTIRQQGSIIPAVGEVRQRVISARLHRVKSLQNQLGDAQNIIAELTNENRLLRTLHKRQDSALARYENTNAELPQLLHSHTEEIRMWEARCRNIQNQNKELNMRLKRKDSELLAAKDHNKYLTQLSTNKNLEEREKLTNRVRILESRLLEKDDEIKMLLRRLQLETKNYKTQMYNEHIKYKDLNQKFEKISADLRHVGSSTIEAKSQELLLKTPVTVSRFDQKSPKTGGSSSNTDSSSTSLLGLRHEPKSQIQKLGTIKRLSLGNDEKEEFQLKKTAELGKQIKNGMLDFKDIKYNPRLSDGLESDESSTKLSEYATDDDGFNPEEEVADIITSTKSCDTSARSLNSSIDSNSTEDLNAQSSCELIKSDSSKSDDDTVRQDLNAEVNNTPSKNLNYMKLTNHTLNVRSQPQQNNRTMTRDYRRASSIDSQKKSKLLAALKAIDANESFEN